MKELLVYFTFSVIAFSATAQAPDSLRSQFIRDWERAKAYTKEYLDAMPKDKYDFRAQDSVRTFAQQMLHLAQGNIGLAANGTGKERIWAGQLENRRSAQAPDSVSYYVLTSYDYVIDGIKNMDLAKLWETAGRGNFAATRYSWLLKAFEHQTHHRGQTTIYIRLVGVKPPNEKLF
jgi:uncharacterized damage-inducible protein DinB